MDSVSSDSSASFFSVSSYYSASGGELSQIREKGQRLYPCRHCDIFFTKKYFWYKHVIKEHGKEEREMNKDVIFVCPRCPKKFKHEKSRDAHVRVHNYQIGRSRPTLVVKEIPCRKTKRTSFEGNAEAQDVSLNCSIGG